MDVWRKNVQGIWKKAGLLCSRKRKEQNELKEKNSRKWDQRNDERQIKGADGFEKNSEFGSE